MSDLVAAERGKRHWLENLALQADLTAAELSIPAPLPIEEAWRRVTVSCGISDKELTRIVGERFRLEVADFGTASPAALKLVPASLAERFRVFPLRLDDRHLVLATSEPANALRKVFIFHLRF